MIALSFYDSETRKGSVEIYRDILDAKNFFDKQGYRPVEIDHTIFKYVYSKPIGFLSNTYVTLSPVYSGVEYGRWWTDFSENDKFLHMLETDMSNQWTHYHAIQEFGK